MNIRILLNVYQMTPHDFVKVDVNMADSKGSLPLSIACGAKLKGYSDNSSNAGQQASEDVRDLGDDFMEERIDFVTFLLDHGANVGFGVLKVACQYSDSEWLIDAQMKM